MFILAGFEHATWRYFFPSWPKGFPSTTSELFRIFLSELPGPDIVGYLFENLMAKRSAGLLMYRISESKLQVFLVHPGGPFWANKDRGVWTIHKGEIDRDEDSLDAARREFEEETGFVAQGEFLSLGKIRQKSGKVVEAWAFAGDYDPSLLSSNLCSVEWPPQSGRQIKVPEVDRAGWFDLSGAKVKLIEAQWPFLDRLQDLLETKTSVQSSNGIGKGSP